MKLVPLCVMDEHIWKAKRLQDLKDAMDRYIEAELFFPTKWVDEYTKLYEELTE